MNRASRIKDGHSDVRRGSSPIGCCNISFGVCRGTLHLEKTQNRRALSFKALPGTAWWRMRFLGRYRVFSPRIISLVSLPHPLRTLDYDYGSCTQTDPKLWVASRCPELLHASYIFPVHAG